MRTRSEAFSWIVVPVERNVVRTKEEMREGSKKKKIILLEARIIGTIGHDWFTGPLD